LADRMSLIMYFIVFKGLIFFDVISQVFYGRKPLAYAVLLS
jgi:hypothetical protein